MNIREFIKKKGIQTEIEHFKRFQSVQVGFVNSDGEKDEAEFDVKCFGTKAGIDELVNLFKDFCKENGFKTNTVFSVTVVKSADTMEELQELPD